MAKFDKKKISDPVDPRPVEVPAELRRPESADDRIRRIIREQISPRAAAQGAESLEESEDFDIEDDFEGELPISDHEFHEMRVEYPDKFRQSSPAAAETDRGEAPASPKSRKVKKNDRKSNENGVGSGGEISDPEDRDFGEQD